LRTGLQKSLTAAVQNWSMATTDEPGSHPAVTRTEKHEDELKKLGRSWFAQAREQSEQEKTEVEAWRREHNKWLAFNRRPVGPDPDFD
jgi:hypothetical protein